MIGIQGENGLEEVTKSPCDTSLDANSTNAVENRVVTAELTKINNKISNTKKYTGLVTSNLVVAANGGTATFSKGSTSFNSYEIMYYGYNGWRQTVTVPTGNVAIPLHINATTMGGFNISSASSDGTVTITNNTSQQLTITRIYGINFQ